MLPASPWLARLNTSCSSHLGEKIESNSTQNTQSTVIKISDSIRCQRTFETHSLPSTRLCEQYLCRHHLNPLPLAATWSQKNLTFATRKNVTQQLAIFQKEIFSLENAVILSPCNMSWGCWSALVPNVQTLASRTALADLCFLLWIFLCPFYPIPIRFCLYL